MRKRHVFKQTMPPGMAGRNNLQTLNDLSRHPYRHLTELINCQIIACVNSF